MHELKLKRIYDEPSKDDGVRIFVDRLWARGVKKEEAHLDYWFKDIAPSTELRTWFGHIPERFNEFSKKYKEELKSHTDILKEIKDMLNTRNVTLVYGARDPKINDAVVLKSVIEHMK